MTSVTRVTDFANRRNVIPETFESTTQLFKRFGDKVRNKIRKKGFMT